MELDCSKVKGIIWDVDGTILDSMPIWDDMSARYLRSKGIEPRDDLNDNVLHMTIDEGVHYVKVTYNMPEPEEELKEGLLSLIRKFYYEEAEFKPGVRELIEGFASRGIPMVIATSGDKDLASRALERLGVMKYIKGIYTSNDLNTNKEQPFIFYRASMDLLDMGQELDNWTESLELAGDDLMMQTMQAEEDYPDLAKLDGADPVITSFIPCGLTLQQLSFFENNKNVLAGIYVIEDSLKATKTVKEAGYSTIAVEDNASKCYWEELKQTADIYLHSLEELVLK